MTPWPELDVTNIHTIFDDTATANEELQHGDQGGVVTAYLAMPVAKSKVTAKAKAVASTTAVKAGAKLMAKALAGPPPPPKASQQQEVCPHEEVRTGSNQYLSWTTCKACSLRLETGAPRAPKTKSVAATETPNECLHANVRTGANQFVSYKTCKDCNTRLETGPPKAPKTKSGADLTVPPPTKATRALPSAAAATDGECPHTSVRSGANQYSSYVTCTLCNVRLSTTPKAKSFVGLAEAMTNSREDEETEEAKAKSHAEVMGLITKITEDTSLAMTAEIEEMVETLRAKVGIGIWDTGCRKTVAGATWIKTYVQALAGLGYTAEFAACTEKFKFGNQGTLACTRCWYLPVMMNGRMGTLAVHEVAGDCPLLISEESMTRLGVVLRLRAKRIDIEDLEIAGEELEFHPRSGHPIVRLLPTTKNATAGATCEDQFVGQIKIDMPEDSDG